MTKLARTFGAVLVGFGLITARVASGAICGPITTCPADIAEPTPDGAGVVVTYVASCTDECGIATFACTPPSGSVFPTGPTQVTCTCDGSMGGSSSCSFSITIFSVNTPPSFVIGPDVTVPQGGGPQTIPGWVTDIFNSTPPGKADEVVQSVTFSVSNDNPALFSAQPAVTSDGTLSFTPAPGACGGSNVTVVAQDDGGTALGGDDTADPQTAMITITCNTCPTAGPLSITVDQDSQASFQLLGADPDGDPLDYQITQAPAHGVVVVQVQTGAGSYSPAPGYCGPDGFAYRVNDQQCTSDPAVVSVDVACAVIEVNVDVKPGSDPNSFKCRSTGVLPAAILSSPTFDATTVVASTVTLEAGGNVVEAQRHGRGNKVDVDGDGLLDLVVDFAASAVAHAIGCPLPARTVVPVTIEGETADGRPFAGSDTLRIAR